MSVLRTRIMSVMAAAVCLQIAGGPAVSGPSLDAYERLVGKWVDVRTQLASERRDWEEKKHHWLEEIRLLETEKAALEEEISETGALASSAETQRARLLERKQRMETALDGLRPLLDRAEAHAGLWQARIPPSLMSGLRKAFLEIPATHQQAKRMSVTRRLQLVVALFTEVESLQNNLHVVKEMVPVKAGQRREVDVLYMGLCRAFAVSADGEWAAVGEPVTDGWRWSVHPELGPSIRKAIAVFTRRRPAELIDLPLKVQGLPGAEEGGQP